MHHDSRYLSDPDLFYPDRWTKDAMLQLPGSSYFPFGGGIRGCVDESFVWTERVLILATIAREYHDVSH
jgi:cytochrome P450